MKPEKIQQAQTIKECRKRFDLNDTPELQAKRKKFMGWLIKTELPKEIKYWKGKSWNGLPAHQFYSVIEEGVSFLEMYQYEGDIIKTKKETQEPSKYANTKTKIITETSAEIDRLSLNESVKVICEICLSLNRARIHYAVFFAEGQRSPWIKIYDFYQLKTELNTKRERYIAQLQFWKQVCPFLFHHLDFSVWHEDHLQPLEFSPHWKYGSPFNLMFEWIPQEKKCKD